MKRVLLIDDHPVVRAGIRRVLEDAGDIAVGEAGSAPEALRLLSDADWDVAVLDISLPGRSGLDLLCEIRGSRPSLPVLMLSMHHERELAVRAIKAGAAGYLTKDCSASELLRALRTVFGGYRYLSAEITDWLVKDVQSRGEEAPHGGLSPRELEVMLLIARGRSLSEISSLLAISRNTVSTYRRRVLGKLDLTRSAELTRYAMSRGLLE